MGPKYDDFDYCPNCSGENIVTPMENVNGHIAECVTRCVKCDHVDHWAYGHYEEGRRPTNVFQTVVVSLVITFAIYCMAVYFGVV
ncbi:MAG: hypothetical protein [Podoviridae sp. ctpVR23]|nr:MAG: hypothetical protein [Podoviridae sp. ctpVR23]